MLGNTCGKTWGSSLTLDWFFFVVEIDPSWSMWTCGMSSTMPGVNEMEARKILAGESCEIIQFALWKARIWKWKQAFFSGASWKSNAIVDGFSHRTLLQLLQSWILAYLITTLLSQYSWTGFFKGETRKSFGFAAVLCIGLYKIILLPSRNRFL